LEEGEKVRLKERLYKLLTIEAKRITEGDSFTELSLMNIT